MITTPKVPGSTSSRIPTRTRKRMVSSEAQFSLMNFIRQPPLFFALSSCVRNSFCAVVNLAHIAQGFLINLASAFTAQMVKNPFFSCLSPQFGQKAEAGIQQSRAEDTVTDRCPILNQPFNEIRLPNHRISQHKKQNTSEQAT